MFHSNQHSMATSPTSTRVTLIPGDGIGPECIESARRIIDAAGAGIEWEVCEAGESVFKKGIPSGVPPETIDSIRRTRCVLKGPLGTPVGYGEKSANVTLRKLFETFANVRPVREMPGVPTPYSGRGLTLLWSEKMSRTFTRASSTCKRQELRNVSSLSVEKEVKKSFVWHSNLRVLKDAKASPVQRNPTS